MRALVIPNKTSYILLLSSSIYPVFSFLQMSEDIYKVSMFWTGSVVCDGGVSTDPHYFL